MQHYSVKLHFNPTFPRHPETHPQSRKHERKIFHPCISCLAFTAGLINSCEWQRQSVPGESQGALIDVMALQQAEGRIVLTFICVKSFVNFLVSHFPSICLLAYCFSVFFYTQGERVMHSIPVAPWHCRFPQSQLGVNRSLSRWGVCSLTVKIWTYGGCVLGCIRQRMPRVGLLTLAWF